MDKHSTAPSRKHPTRPDTAPNGHQPLPWSDTTNAMAFVAEHGQGLRYCYPWKCWLVWTDTHWQKDTCGVVMRCAKQTIRRLARRIEDLDDAPARTLLGHAKKSLGTGAYM